MGTLSLPRGGHGRQRSLRALRRSSRARLTELGLPDTFDLSILQDRLSATRGKPIHILPMSLEVAGPCGLWISVDDAEYILYEEKTSRHHREHIIAHEFSHMICDHRIMAASPAAARTTARLFPGLEPSAAQRVLVRENLSDAQEREAEMLASIILTSAGRPPRESSTGTAGRAGQALGLRD